jgi:predicted SAM-dependent methyltransferase
MLKLNLGCGPVQPAGWVNVDGSNRAWLASRLPWLDRLLVRLRLLPPTEFTAQTTWADLRRRLPWDDGTVDAIYLGEVLEHFTRDQGQRLLGECRRVLKPDGVLRLRVPDNANFWRQYLAEYDEVRSRPPAEWANDHTRWVALFFRDICTRPRRFGYAGHYHKWMYDEVSLTLALREAGFVAQRRTYLDSAIADVAAVEVAQDLIMEARPAAATQRAGVLATPNAAVHGVLAGALAAVEQLS